MERSAFGTLGTLTLQVRDPPWNWVIMHYVRDTPDTCTMPVHVRPCPLGLGMLQSSPKWGPDPNCTWLHLRSSSGSGLVHSLARGSSLGFTIDWAQCEPSPDQTAPWTTEVFFFEKIWVLCSTSDHAILVTPPHSISMQFIKFWIRLSDDFATTETEKTTILMI